MNYQGWWISGQYVNTYGHQEGFIGCNGGHVLAVNPGDTLKTELAFSKYLGWTQMITDLDSHQQISYTISLPYQAGSTDTSRKEEWRGPLRG